MAGQPGNHGKSFRNINKISISGNKTGSNMIVKIRKKEMSVASGFKRNEVHTVQTSQSN